MLRRVIIVLAVGAAATGCKTAAPVGPAAHPASPASAAAALPATAAAASGTVARARAELAEGRIAQAQVLFEQAARETPADPEAHLGLAKVAFANAKLSAAVEHADRAISLRAGPEALVLRGRTHGFLGRLDEAARDLEAATERNPRDVEAWAALVAVHTARGDGYESRRAFGEAKQRAGEAGAIDRAWTQMVGIRADPVQPQEALDRCSRGHAAALAERWVDAQHEYVNGLKRATRFEWCGVQLAYAQWKTGNREGAEGGLRRLVDIFDPTKPELRADARGMLAEVLLASGKPAEAADEARAALAVRPDRVALLETLARACDRKGDAGCAQEAWARVLARPHVTPELRAFAEQRAAALGATPMPASAKP